MQVDVTQVLLNLDGDPIKQVDPKWEPPTMDPEELKKIVPPKIPLTLQDAIVNALLGLFEDEQKLAGTERLRRYKLAKKVHSCEGEFKFSAEDLELVKKCVEKLYGTLVAGVVYCVLEEESEAVEAVKEA